MVETVQTGPSRRSRQGLDWLSFFIADVQTGFGPFVAVYLASRGWPPGEIGIVLAIGGIASVVSQAPGGALVDQVVAKRLLIGVAIAFLAAGALLVALWPSFWPVAIAEALHGCTSGIIKSGLAAVGLGLVGHDRLSRRLGRNQRFNSVGTALTAGVMGVLGYFASGAAPFFAAAALCLPAGLALCIIRGVDIDYAEAGRSPIVRIRARGVGCASRPAIATSTSSCWVCCCFRWRTPRSCP